MMIDTRPRGFRLLAVIFLLGENPWVIQPSAAAHLDAASPIRARRTLVSNIVVGSTCVSPG